MPLVAVLRRSASAPTHPAMLHWQYQQILAEIQLLALHAADPTCPCTLSDLDPPEFCIPKHCLSIMALARETGAMDKPRAVMLEKLGDEAQEKHEAMAAFICNPQHREKPELIEWARDWRKKVEPIYYACQIAQKGGHRVTLHQEPREKRLATGLGTVEFGRVAELEQAYQQQKGKRLAEMAGSR